MKKRKIYAITPEQMRLIKKQEENKIAKYAEEHGISIEDARKTLISRGTKKTKNKSSNERSLPKKQSQSKKKEKKERKPQLQLISKRGTRVEGTRKCSKCKKTFNALWRYAESTQGTVYFCMSCKSKVRSSTKRKIDALDLAYTGGRFEGNRRRH